MICDKLLSCLETLLCFIKYQYLLLVGQYPVVFGSLQTCKMIVYRVYFLCIFTFIFIDFSSCLKHFYYETSLTTNFRPIGKKIAELIDLSVPFGVQRPAVFILSNKTIVKDISNEIIASIVTSSDGVIRPLFVVSNSLHLENKKRPAKSSFNIILTDNLMLSQFFDTIKGQSPLKIFNPKVVTLFLVVEGQKLQYQVIDEIFQKIFSVNIMNCFVVHIKTENNSTRRNLPIKSFNYYPYAATHDTKVKEFNILTTKFQREHLEKDKNLNGHRLRLIQYDDPPKSYTTLSDQLRGYDGMLMRVICEKLNATPKVIRLPCTDRFTVSSAIKLYNGSGDISINSQMFLSRDYSNSTFDYIYPQTLESLNLLVPIQIASSWGYLSVFRPFKLEIWIVLLLTL